MGCLSVTDPEEEVPAADGKEPTLAKAIAQGCELKTIRQFWRLGLPGGAMMAADASSFDVTTAFAGALGNLQSNGCYGKQICFTLKHVFTVVYENNSITGGLLKCCSPATIQSIQKKADQHLKQMI